MPPRKKRPPVFTLHPQLKRDTIPLGNLGICRVLLMNNSRFPWLILVPRRKGLRELHDLAPPDYRVVMREVRMVSKALASHTAAYKMNIAALGNVVPQLHIHIIARFQNDPAWPKPIWGVPGKPSPYTPEAAAHMVNNLRAAMPLKINITKM